MGLKILLSSAAGGKTNWVVEKTLEYSRGLKTTPRIIVPSRLQALDFDRRLAKKGGAMGVIVGTFNDLAQAILDESGTHPILISEITQGRLLENLLQDLQIDYYVGIKEKPGFIQICLQFIRELEAGGITPDEFIPAVKKIKSGPRLLDLAVLYKAYSQELRKKNWLDSVSLIWKAADLIGEKPELWQDWGPIFFDGFDDFSPVQLNLVNNLAQHQLNISITLTGVQSVPDRALVHKRFNRLREKLINNQSIGIEFLEEDKTQLEAQNPFRMLEKYLFSSAIRDPIKAGQNIKMAAVPDREAEVRTALRWLRELLIRGEIHAGEAAIIMRNQEPYRELVHRIAREYQMPVYIQGGLPLDINPAISALLSLLRLAGSGKSGLIWHEVISIWRSPYFDWRCINTDSSQLYDRTAHLGDANQLAEIARWGSVIQGIDQWEDVFSLLIHSEKETFGQHFNSPMLPERLPTGREAEKLWHKFSSFVDLLTPPEGAKTLHSHIAWIEDLLGPVDDENGGVGFYDRIQEGPEEFFQRDWQAARILTKIFKEQIWSDRALREIPITFDRYFMDLEAGIKRTSYQPVKYEMDAILCADCTEVRGISYKAVVLVGLAEGEFPGTIKEDPFFRDEDKRAIQELFFFPLRLSVDSGEAEYFYEAITRSSEYLLLTRPRIADNGAPWQPSPYWDEILRCLDTEPEITTNRHVPPINQAASRGELYEFLSSGNGKLSSGWEEAKKVYPEYSQKILHAANIIAVRSGDPDHVDGKYDGDLGHFKDKITNLYPLDHVWSASRLENYQLCPFNYFISNLLRLEMPEPPGEGLDARQLGNIYHHILQGLYQMMEGNYGVQDLLRELPAAAEKVYLQAPRKEGFRETVWWRHTQDQILENLKRSLIVLEAMDSSFRFYQAEQRFGIRRGEEPELVIPIEGEGSYRLRGFIDRVDRNKNGQIRII
ncbi:MAG: PD-(D/E)XK nuclease family protein, partial [Anaerolineales bacterium]|nr:PD-(D/E)XK nuclease family protein [Anaerolineales bacterium]